MHFSLPFPALAEDLAGATRKSLVVAWLVSSLGGCVLVWFGGARLMWGLGVLCTVASVFTLGACYEARSGLPTWSFYRLRFVALPYALLAPVALIAGLLSASVAVRGALLVFVSASKWMLRDLAERWPQVGTSDDSLQAETFLQRLSELPWIPGINELLVPLAWSTGITVAVAWLLPPMLKHDYKRLVVYVLALFAPMVTGPSLRLLPRTSPIDPSCAGVAARDTPRFGRSSSSPAHL